MLKRRRSFISATLIAILVASTLILSNPFSTQACPAPPPDTLIALYLKSDLIVVADIASEKDGKVITDYEDYYNVEVIRNLKVSAVLKGKPPANFIFTRTEYRDKTKSAEESVSDDEFGFAPYGYKGFVKLRAEERYLFFFIENAEDGEYELTDFVSGAKKLNDYDLSVHKKRLKELQAIEKMKKNQLAALTEWLIRCIEEPSTRWDGVFELHNSFESLEYADKDDEAAEFKFDEDFNTYSPAIAKNLTFSQKEYLSSIVFSILQQNSFYESEGYYYSLSRIVSRWDKSRLAVYSFNMLQTIDNSEIEKTRMMMNYISEILDDEKLSEIVERFPVSDSPTEEEEKPEETNDADSVEKPVVNTENVSQNTEQNTENKIEANKANISPKTKKSTPAEIRQKLLQDFAERYQYLVANGFQTEEETDSSDK